MRFVQATVTTPWTDKDVARKAVRMETRLETTLEGNRWYDLKRWGVLSETINDYLQRETLAQYVNVTYTDDFEYLPLDHFYTENPDLLGAPALTTRRKMTDTGSGLHNDDHNDPLPAHIFNNPKQK